MNYRMKENLKIVGGVAVGVVLGIFAWPKIRAAMSEAKAKAAAGAETGKVA